MRTLAIATCVLLLAGCAATPGGGAACTAFENVNDALVKSTNDTSMSDADRVALYGSFASDLDAIALTADGDVKVALTRLVDDLPPVASDLFLGLTGDASAERTTFETNVDRVVNACTAAGADIAPLTLP